MKGQMQDLVSMRDVETLYEIMISEDDWMLQLDAAEGLIELDDRRGLEYLQSALDSEVLDMAESAREILDSPRAKAMQEEIEAEKRHLHAKSLVEGKKRLLEGQRVFRYKVIYLPAGSFLKEGLFGEGSDVGELNEHGLQGWEVVNTLPNIAGGAGGRPSGVTVLLKKELSQKDAAELDKL